MFPDPLDNLSHSLIPVWAGGAMGNKDDTSLAIRGLWIHAEYSICCQERTQNSKQHTTLHLTHSFHQKRSKPLHRELPFRRWT